jgi:hypothetical protein
VVLCNHHAHHFVLGRATRRFGDEHVDLWVVVSPGTMKISADVELSSKSAISGILSGNLAG